MAFTDVEQVDIRRFTGYPALGSGKITADTLHFFQAGGLLEYRINNLTESEEVVVRKHLDRCNSLEDAVFAATDNLDTAQAGPWVHNEREQTQRDQAFAAERYRLCQFLAVDPGPTLVSAGRSRNIRIIV